MTVEDWLDDISEAKQDDVLGAGKAKLYREGKITLRDLLDQSERRMTLKALQDKYSDSKVSSMIKAYRPP